MLSGDLSNYIHTSHHSGVCATQGGKLRERGSPQLEGNSFSETGIVLLMEIRRCATWRVSARQILGETQGTAGIPKTSRITRVAL